MTWPGAVASILADRTVALELIVIDQSTDDAQRTRAGAVPRVIGCATSGARRPARAPAFKRRSPSPGPRTWCSRTTTASPRPAGCEGISRPLLEHPDVGLVFSTVATPDYDRSLGYIPAYTCPRNRVVNTVCSTWVRARGWARPWPFAATRCSSIGGFDPAFGPGARLPFRRRRRSRGPPPVEGMAGVRDRRRRHRPPRLSDARGGEGAHRAGLVRPGGMPREARSGRTPRRRPASRLWLLLRRALIPAAVDAVHLRKPKLRRVAAFGSGFARGLTVPVDRETLKYRA